MGGAPSQPSPYSAVNNPNYGHNEVYQKTSTKQKAFDGSTAADYFKLPGGESAYNRYGSKGTKFGPGKYDYYIGTGEFSEIKGEKYEKFVQYKDSKEGKGIVSEQNAQVAKNDDLISGRTLEMTKKRNQQQMLKNMGAANSPGKAKKTAGNSLIVDGPLNTETLLGGGSAAKTLLGS